MLHKLMHVMRYLYLDPFESHEPYGGEEIAFAQSHVRVFEDISAFFLATKKFEGFAYSSARDLPQLRYLSQVVYSRYLLEFLSDETDLSLRNDAQLYVFFDEWDVFDVLFQVDHTFVRFLFTASG